MKVKYVIGLVISITLSAGLAIAQQPAPPATPPESPEEFGNSFSFFIDGGGFLGVYGEDITSENVARYRLNQPRGVGITQVIKDSPAEKAGLRKDDVILRLDGENVTSVRKLNRLVSEIAPDHGVRIAISRNGSEQEITATMGKRKNTSFVLDFISPESRSWKWEGPLTGGDTILNNNNDLTFMLSNSRRIGVSTVALTKQLADYFGIADGRGVLVTNVSEDGPAAKAGIKAGDVITAIDGEAIDSPGDISRVISRKKEGEVSLTVIRNKSQQTFRVTPREGGFTGTLSRPQVGRQIVIPRIQFPDIEVAMPRIQIPTFPSVNINLPPIRISPRIRRVRGVYGPI
ncbi:MAG TPA: PDZ domain-containing protein [Pyrinomonadaceae bacterium]|jgi:serine protease Do|nr:PDZ domain-containing protein [Pyrinomonadaceae bacterium]